MVDEHDVATPFVDQVTAQLDGSIIGFANERTHARDHAEFFRKLAHERLLGGLAGFDLAARKFPVAAVAPTGFALNDQQAAVADEQSADDVDHAAFVTARIRSARRFRSSRSRAYSGAISWSTPASR